MKRSNNVYNLMCVLLKIIQVYLIFGIITFLAFYIHIQLFQDYPEKWLNISAITISILLLLGPVNTMIILLLYILKINESVLLKLKIVIFESILYSLLAILLDYIGIIPTRMLNYSFLFPYLVIIPIFMIGGYLGKRR